MKSVSKKSAPVQSVTIITLSVNGHLVEFTFAGTPSPEYMESARLAAEAIENAARAPEPKATPFPRSKETLLRVGARVQTLRHGTGRIVRNDYHGVLVDLDMHRSNLTTGEVSGLYLYAAESLKAVA